MSETREKQKRTEKKTKNGTRRAQNGLLQIFHNERIKNPINDTSRLLFGRKPRFAELCDLKHSLRFDDYGSDRFLGIHKIQKNLMRKAPRENEGKENGDTSLTETVAIGLAFQACGVLGKFRSYTAARRPRFIRERPPT